MKDFKNIHFIGVGGVGTGPLLPIAKAFSKEVSGSDMTENKYTEKLKSMGYKVFIGHCIENIPDVNKCLIVYSSAIKSDNPEIIRAKEKGFDLLQRGIFLANLAEKYSRCVAVTGSHGKTTVSAMLSHVLKKLKLKPGFLVGGSVAEWDFPSDPGNGDLFVTEADESDGTNTFFKPYLGIITNIESDHSWSVGGEEVLKNNFAKFAENSKIIVCPEKVSKNPILSAHPNLKTVSGFENPEDYQKLNEALAVKTAEVLGVHEFDSRKALETFPGVDRRMQCLFDNGETLLYEDYAHHPTELQSALTFLQQKHPDKKIHAVFQPHRYARLEKFIDEFAEILRNTDKVTVTPVFAAWTGKASVNSGTLVEKIGPKATMVDENWHKVADSIFRNKDKNELIAVIGAGTVEQLAANLKKLLVKL